MKLKLTTSNGFKSEFNISPYFIISIGILVIQLHQAGLIWALFIFVRCVLFVNGQPFLVVSVAGIEIARLEISLQVALTLIALGIPICS